MVQLPIKEIESLVKECSKRTLIPRLKEAVANGGMTFEGKDLICNFFTPLEFTFELIENIVSIKAHTKTRSFPLTDASLVVMGEFPIVIYKQTLYISSMDVAYCDLKRGWKEGLFEVSRDEVAAIINAYPTIIHQALSEEEQDLPTLKLTDRTGGFAKLYAKDRQWEKDLLTTPYQKRFEEFYCPLHRVGEALSFLLELGWNIEDIQGKKLVRLTDSNLNVDQQANQIQLTGSLTFDQDKKDVKDVIGSFNRKERFISLTPNEVGLLPEASPLTEIAQNTFTIVSDGISFAKETLGSFLDEEEALHLSPSIQNFSKPSLIQPSKRFKGVLRPYQQLGLSWLTHLHKNGYGALLADDMGLGKTIQVLAFLSHRTEKTLIVAPTSLLFNWRDEIERFLPGQNIELISYGYLRENLDQFLHQDYETIVIDEGQVIKNSHTKTAQAIFKLKASFKISLSGTPIENHINELHSQFRFLIPGLLEIGDTSFQLKKKVSPFFLRRKKEEVAKDLPERIDQTIYVEMREDQQALYDRFLQSSRTKIDLETGSKKKMQIFETLLRLRQICCHPPFSSRRDIFGEMGPNFKRY
ncbi:SNF2-related protein [Chlamydiales bacterium]|nr:SNF2-related protein [Chlamydiales bacterium]